MIELLSPTKLSLKNELTHTRYGCDREASHCYRYTKSKGQERRFRPSRFALL